MQSEKFPPRLFPVFFVSTSLLLLLESLLDAFSGKIIIIYKVFVLDACFGNQILLISEFN